MANENLSPDDAGTRSVRGGVGRVPGRRVGRGRSAQGRGAAGQRPRWRARAAELKKSFDMLDYLPRAEPSANFTTRTLDKLPAVKPSDSPAAGQTKTSPIARPTRTTSQSGGVSTSMPIPLDDDPPAPARSRTVAGRAGRGDRRVRRYRILRRRPVRDHTCFLRARSSRKKRKLEPAPRVIEHLPLYAVTDDLAFVTDLARPEYFGEDPAVAYDPTLRSSAFRPV